MSVGWVAPAIVDRVIEFAVERGIPRGRLEAIVPRTGMPIRGDAARGLLAYVVRELGEPASVWHVARRVRPADYGAYGFALQASDTLGDALVRGSRHFGAIATTIGMAISTSERTATVVVRRRDGADSIGARLGTLYVVGQILQMVSNISGRRMLPRAVHLAHAAWGDARSLDSALGVIPTFDAPMTSIVFERAALQLELPRRDPDLARHLDRELERSQDHPESAAVRRAIERAIALGASTAEEDIARALGASARTLRRRLAEEMTTMRALSDDVRLEIAADRLRHREMPLAQLAFELGFSDQTALSRAFRRWTGRSPSEFRRAELAEQSAGLPAASTKPEATSATPQ